MKYRFTTLAALAALALSPAAFAQGYVGFGIGATQLNVDCSGTTSCDNSDTGFKLYGGYKFTPNIAGELMYLGFGKAKATFPGGTGAELKTTGFGAGVAFSGEFSPDWSGVARVGIARMKGDLSGTAVGASTSETSTQAYLGLGIGYAVAKNITLDLSADFSRAKYRATDGTTDTASTRMVGVGITVGF